ncbi:hypothetical protein [Rheinheimera texasensis]|uniref:hypothetical protein n=1 Tax=Rheinheimera texasensis TaxID=306205 RepID=UPI000AEFB8C4|nr:hypothetical protein [Rheinheimera texasensis]
MDTDMVIMRSNNFPVMRLAPLWLAMVPILATAEVKISPSVSSAVYAYGIKDQTVDADKGMAYELVPELNLTYTGSWLSSSLNLQSQNLSFDDAQRDNQSLFSYRWSGNASFLNDALDLQLGAQQNNRRASGSTARYQDQISSTSDLAKVESQSASLVYSHDRFDWAIMDFSISASRSTSDLSLSEFDNDSGEGLGLENSAVAGAFELKTQDRNRKFFWGFNGQATKTDRDIRESQYNRRAQGVIGVPFFWRVSMIATGSVENNSNIDGGSSVFSQYRNHRSIGGGLEWKITDRSWWNVTYNKVNNAKDDKEYLGTAFELVPSKRTKISGSLDKRFFGRTAQAKGSYKLKHLRMELNVSDTVGSLLGLNEGDLETNLFVCPPGVTPGLDSCFQPPTANYLPAAGERYYNVSNPTSDLSEFLVVRRNVSYLLGYDFNRLKLAARFGQRKDQLIERNSVRDDKFVNLSANWQLNARNSVTLSTDYSDLVYQVDGVNSFSDLTGIVKSMTLTFTRKINKSLTANANLKRINVDYGSDSRDYQENRAWIGVEYKF